MRPSVELCVVLLGNRSPEGEQRAQTFGGRVTSLEELADSSSVEQLANRANLVWLHPRAQVDEALVREVQEWFDRSAVSAGGVPSHAPGFATAHQVLISRGGSAPVGKAVVVSRPGAIAMRGHCPMPGTGASGSQLRLPWRLDALRSLEAHLEAVNAETTFLARRARAAGHGSTWTDLVWRPLGLLFRGLALARGRRREIVPHLAIEAYRGTLLTAKLWESRLALEPARSA